MNDFLKQLTAHYPKGHKIDHSVCPRISTPLWLMQDVGHIIKTYCNCPSNQKYYHYPECLLHSTESVREVERTCGRGEVKI